MNTYEIAKAIYNADDIQLAEIFAHYNKMRFNDRVENNLKREDMDFNVSEMCCNLESTLKEIIFDENVDSSAWWKDDTFFGRNTPKAKFLAQDSALRERLLMETAIRCQEIFTDLQKSGKIVDKGDRDIFSVWNDFKDLCYEYEYIYFDTDDFLDTTDKFFTEMLMEMFPVPKPELIGVTAYKSDVIKGWDGDDNLLYIEAEEPVIFAWFTETALDSFKPDKEEGVSDKGLFEEWLHEYTADDTVGLYDWIINRGFTCKVKEEL